jgi:hypothetical protein
MIDFDSLNAGVKKHIVDQKYVNTALYLFLILYAGLAAPKLPSYIAKLFDHVLFRLVVLFLIAYLSVKDVKAALLVSLGLVITLVTLNNHKVNGAITNFLQIKQEQFMPRVPERMMYDMVTPPPPPPQRKHPHRVRFEEAFEGQEYASI